MVDGMSLRDWVTSLLVNVVWKWIVKNVDTEKIEQMFEVAIENWCEKHLNPDEIISEGKDLAKLIKEKL